MARVASRCCRSSLASVSRGRLLVTCASAPRRADAPSPPARANAAAVAGPGLAGTRNQQWGAPVEAEAPPREPEERRRSVKGRHVSRMRAREEIQKRRAISERNRRLAGFGSAAALTGLAMWGQDMLSMLGDVTGLPIEEVDFAVYFMACFLVVHTVLPKSYRS